MANNTDQPADNSSAVRKKRGPKPRPKGAKLESALEKKRRSYTKAILALMNHGTVEEAARSIGVNEVWFRAWMQDEEFIQMFRQAQEEAVGLAIAQIHYRIPESIRVLHELAMDEEINAGVRITAIAKEIEVITRTAAGRAQTAAIQQLMDELTDLKAKNGQQRRSKEARASVEASGSKRAQSNSSIPALLPSFGEEAGERGYGPGEDDDLAASGSEGNEV